MTALWNRWIETIASALDPRERECVLGDIAELNLSGPKATASLLGLVLRRQLDTWKHWRPWLILIGIVVPTALLLSRVASDMAAEQSVYLWMYVSNWTATYLQPGWLWSELIPQFTAFFLAWLVLMGWSWTGGFILASLSRAGTGICAALFALILFLSTWLLLQANAAISTHNSSNAVVFANVFYRIIFPIGLQAFLVLLPMLQGARQARRRRRITSLHP